MHCPKTSMIMWTMTAPGCELAVTAMGDLPGDVKPRVGVPTAIHRGGCPDDAGPHVLLLQRQDHFDSARSATTPGASNIALWFR